MSDDALLASNLLGSPLHSHRPCMRTRAGRTTEAISNGCHRQSPAPPLPITTLLDGDADDLDFLLRLLLVNPDVFDLMDHIQSLYRPPEDRVFFVEPGCLVYRCDEELRSVGVGPRISHTDRVRFVVLERREFVLEFLAPDTFSPGTVTERISALFIG